MNSIIKVKIWSLLLILLIIGVSICNYLWIKMDAYPVEGHELSGLIPAVQAFRELKGMGNPYKSYDRILGRYPPLTPPLSYLVVVVFYILFGLQGQMVVMVNTVYSILTFVAVYLIGKHILNERVGLLSVFILSSCPGFIAFSRTYWIEFGLMAYVSLDLYLLLKTNFFEHRRYSILFGIFLALSFFHKYEFILFILGPLLLVIHKSQIIKDSSNGKWTKKIPNFIITLIIPIALICILWGQYIKEFWARINQIVLLADDPLPDDIPFLRKIFSYESLTFYFDSIKRLIGIIFLSFLSLSIIHMIVDNLEKQRRFYVHYFSLCILLPYIILTCFKAKSFSHILSTLPAAAILISMGIYLLKNKTLKIASTVLIILFCLNLHLYSIQPIKALNRFNYLTLGLRFPPTVFFLSTCNPPRQEQFELGIKEILALIRDNSDAKEQQNVFIAVAYKNIELGGSIFEYYSLLNDYPIRFFVTLPSLPPRSPPTQFDFIIIEKYEEESMAEIRTRIYNPTQVNLVLRKILEDGLGDYALIKIYKIPNGNTSAYIYKRKKSLQLI